MRARRGVDFVNRLERRAAEAAFEPRECRPEAAMDVGHFARHEAADEYIARRSHGARQPEELLAARAAAEGGFEEARHGPARGLEHDAVLGDEAEGLAGSHGSTPKAIVARRSPG